MSWDKWRKGCQAPDRKHNMSAWSPLTWHFPTSPEANWLAVCLQCQTQQMTTWGFGNRDTFHCLMTYTSVCFPSHNLTVDNVASDTEDDLMMGTASGTQREFQVWDVQRVWLQVKNHPGSWWEMHSINSAQWKETHSGSWIRQLLFTYAKH